MRIIKWISISIILFILIIVIYIYVNADSFVASLLHDSMPDHIELNYDNISTNVFGGDIVINDVDVIIKNKKDSIEYGFVDMKRIVIEGISYWQYLVHDKIKLKEIVINDPVITYFPSLVAHEIDSLKQEDLPLNRSVFLDGFKIANGQLVIMSDNLDSITLSVANLNLQVSQISTDSSLQTEVIPINYENISLDMKEVVIKLSDYEKLFIHHVLIDENRAEVNDFQIHSIYSKQRMLPLLPEEREHFAIQIPSIIMDSINYGFNDNKFYLYAGDLTIQEAEILVHLDKRLKDRTRIKPMYSKLIRDLPFTLHIDSTWIKNSTVVYEEKHEEGIPAGIVRFNALNAQIYDISNRSKSGLLTRVYANALVMGKSEASIDWKFDVQNHNDEFTLSGKASNFDASSVDRFLNSFYKASLSGHVDQLYFTVSGNDKHSKGDFKMKYKDLKIEILKDDRSKKHRLKSFIGNVLVNSGKDGDSEGFRHSQISADRNLHKPFFNFIWLIVRDGATKAIRKNKERKDS